MPKTFLPLRADDLTTFTRTLSDQLGPSSPSHLTLMNMVARAAGFQNVQHMRASHAAWQRLSRADEDIPPDARAVERALNQFDSKARLKRWPSKRSVQTLVLWGLWATIPVGKVMAEKEVNSHLARQHLFGDPATLRRMMISGKLLSRRKDGTNYLRIEQKPPAEAAALIRALAPRRQGRKEDLKAAGNA